MLEPTHIISLDKTNEIEALYRASDGMRVGVAAQQCVIFGENPQKGTETRAFLSSKWSFKFLREVVAVEDLRARRIEGDPVFKEIDEEALIVSPPGSKDINMIVQNKVRPYSKVV